MSIKSVLLEIEGIKVELKSLNKRAKGLRQRKKLLDGQFKEYLDSKNLPGVKFGGKEYRLEVKEIRVPKKPKERDTDAIQILEDEGIRDPDMFLRRLLEARRGDLVPSKNIKIKNLKQEQY